MIFWVSLTLFLCILNVIGIACVFAALSNSIIDLQNNLENKIYGLETDQIDRLLLKWPDLAQDGKEVEKKVSLKEKGNLKDGK